jgi:hypothetical protein
MVALLLASLATARSVDHTTAVVALPFAARPAPGPRAAGEVGPSSPCDAAPGDPRNWRSHHVAVAGGDVCATRTFHPTVPNDVGHDVLVSRDSTGRTRWTRTFAAPVQRILPDGGRILVLGAGGLLVLETSSGSETARIALDGYVGAAVGVGDVLVLQAGGRYAGVELDPVPRLLWTAALSPLHAGPGLLLCHDRLLVPVATRTFPDPGSFVARGELSLVVIDPRSGPGATLPAGRWDQFFDQVRVSATCAGEQVQVDAAWIVLD